MPDFPSVQTGSPFTEGIISAGGWGANLGEVLVFLGNAQNATAIWPAALRALYCPVKVLFPLTVYKMAWLNGSVVAGNVDVGIYDVNGTRLVSTGMVAMSGVSVIQVADITDTPLLPGNYFLAMNASSATATFERAAAPDVLTARACGMQQQLITTPGTLPDPWVPANTVSSFVPLLVAIYNSAVF